VYKCLERFYAPGGAYSRGTTKFEQWGRRSFWTPFGLQGAPLIVCMYLKTVVGPWRLERQTSTVSR
jgi:hypothetical protein